IFVTGKLGGSLKKHHLDFIPRLAEGQWLAAHGKLHAMMDLSDGLACDLPRMASASGVDFVIKENALPRNPGCTPVQAWGDGEDYELFFAVPSRAAAALEKKWRLRFPKVRLTSIGRFVPRGQGQVPTFAGQRWEHFKS